MRIVRIDDPIPALELVRRDGTGWFLTRLPARARLRLRFRDWPRPRLCLEDTPRPNCPECEGTGGWWHDYGDYDTGEYAGTNWDPCACWSGWPDPVLTIPLPRWTARRRTTSAGYSDEPPY